jgi:glycosyltransferase involved in cell wall biosynthesis
VRIAPARRMPATARLPHVQIVVPCYNYGHYLPDCVGSLVSQQGVTVDVLVIDDASTDDSVSVAAQLADRHPEVRLVAHSENAGHIATYNEGLSAADSDYLVLLSADDMLAPGALQRATAIMEWHPSVGLVYGHPQDFTDEPVSSPGRFSSWSTWRGDEWIGAQFRHGINLIYSPEAVVRTSVHHEVGYYRPELPHSGDLEMWLRVASASDVGRVNGHVQAYRRIHQQSMMRTFYAGVIDDLERRDDAYESFLATAGARLPNIDALRATIRRRMSYEALGWACTVLRTPDAAPAAAERAVAFARSMYPGYESLRVWREFRRLAEPAGEPRSRFAGRADPLLRDLGDRMHWRHWRYFGV